MAEEEAQKAPPVVDTVFLPGVDPFDPMPEEIAPVLREGFESLQEASVDELLPVLRVFDQMEFSGVTRSEEAVLKKG